MTEARRRTVAVVHPWMPHYRVAFFDLLREDLERNGITLRVSYGGVPPFAKGRGGDDQLDWATQLEEHSVAVGGRTINWRKTSPEAIDSDLLILEDGLRNVDTYAYLARRRGSKLTAFWGHGRTRDRSVTEVEARIKRTLVNRGDWFFAYTAGVAADLASDGFDPYRITVLTNTFDVESLSAARDAVSPAEAETFRSAHGLTAGHTALFLGGVSESKNIATLVESARLVSARDPEFRVVVAGDGPLRGLIDQVAVPNGPFVPVGSAFDDRLKATIGSACELMISPGLVGLVAVDSFALGLPIVATSEWHQAPEFEYLEHNRNCLLTPATTTDFADSILRLINDSELRLRLRSNCLAEAAEYRLADMVERFSAGVLAALDAGSTGR